MKVIITKYALTSGVTIAEGELSTTSTRPMFRAKGTVFSIDYYHGHEFQYTKEEAKAQVVKMAEARRKSLQKSLSKIDKNRDKALDQIDALTL